MATHTHTVAVALMRERLQDFLLGYTDLDSARMAQLVGGPWRLAAERERLRRSESWLAGLDDETVAAIASGAVDVTAEAAALLNKLRESAADEPSAAVIAEMREATSEIAKAHLGIDTLEARHSDALDFHDLHVGLVREALGHAFIAGRASKT